MITEMIVNEQREFPYIIWARTDHCFRMNQSDYLLRMENFQKISLHQHTKPGNSSSDSSVLHQVNTGRKTYRILIFKNNNNTYSREVKLLGILRSFESHATEFDLHRE